METLWQDLRYGLRLLRRHPSFTAVAVLTLALGIGANSAIFSVVYAVLLRPLPFQNANRLVAIWEASPQFKQNEVAAANFVDWREQNRVFEQIAALSYASVILAGGDEPERLQAAVVSPSFFAVLGTPPALGRSFLPEEEKPGAARVVVLSHGFWQRRFAADPNLIGKTVTLNGLSRTVVGIMPPDFRLEFPTNRQVDLWLPRVLSAEFVANRVTHFLYVLARLKPGVTITQAQTEMEATARRLTEQYPDTNANRSVRVLSLQEQITGNIRQALLVLLGAVGFVLLIACANVANLLLGRASARPKEIAIRAALGAGRQRIVRQLLTESVLLALVGGALGLLLAFWGIDLITAAGPATIPRLKEIGINTQVLGFTLVVSLLTGVIFGLAPALQASKFDLSQSLKEGSRVATTGSRHRLRSLLVVTESALALMLLIGAGLMLRSFWRLQQVNPGFKPDHVLAMDLALPGAKYAQAHQRAAFFQQVLQRIEAVPGITAAGTVSNLPLSGSNMTTGFVIEGRPAPAPSEVPQIDYRAVSADYFRTLGILLLKGRQFTERDAVGSPAVVIINETMARRFWPGADPTGQRLTITEDPPVSREIVGVVGDVKHYRLDVEPKAEMYVPHLQDASFFMHIVVRTSADPLSAVAAVRREISAVDKDQPIHNIRTMEQSLAASVSQPRFNMLLLVIFATVALALAAGGIYGVISYTVTQRTHEIGIRLALGAERRDILRLVVGQGMALALGGVGLGLVGAWALTRVMSNLLFGVSATDPATFVGVALLLTAVAFAACYLPARRATRVDPMIALRYE